VGTVESFVVLALLAFGVRLDRPLWIPRSVDNGLSEFFIAKARDGELERRPGGLGGPLGRPYKPPETPRDCFALLPQLRGSLFYRRSGQVGSAAGATTRRVRPERQSVPRIAVPVERWWLIDLPEVQILTEESSQFGIEVAG